MKILFIHKNYPAQFGRVAIWLAEHGWDVTFATTRHDVRSDKLRIVRFKEHREPSPATHHYLTGTERAVIAGQGLARTALALRKEGYEPDVVVAHSGWGVGFFVRDIWPDTKYVQYAEWYYNFPYADQTPYSKVGNETEESARTRIRNAPFWLDFSAADATVCPTQYQASRFPEKISEHISVLNDGFDTELHCPGPRDREFLSAQGIPPDAPLVTHVARGMEPTRGFPEVMKAIEQLQRRRSDVHAVIIAEDRVAYGPKSPGQSWKERMLNALDLDTDRLHFTGLVPRATMIRYLQASDAHLYLSAPFVLSWSFVDTMACAAPIVASRSAPVEEFVSDRKSALLVDPCNTGEVTDAIEKLLDDSGLGRRLGRAAREHVVSHYDAESIVYPQQARFFATLAGKDLPRVSEIAQNRADEDAA
ncbi:glycosyltransferase [uncultured Roseobacter sp.]|uniref:glycosyltransferase n=1 Tax=uncultured Roseobacter sp. TaxID=114847 RepID=UPI002623EF4A|nr:glycosyltransferase [uncultured Roseobacter sp.]